MMEALACHPLGTSEPLQSSYNWASALTWTIDTIKVRMQLSRRARAPGVCHLHT
jgi:hypothetical protein